jgi:hypothetical protein
MVKEAALKAAGFTWQARKLLASPAQVRNLLLMSDIFFPPLASLSLAVFFLCIGHNSGNFLSMISTYIQRRYIIQYVRVVKEAALKAVGFICWLHSHRFETCH